MKFIKTLALSTIVGLSASGCVMGPGDKPSDTPPQLTKASDSELPTWDNPSLFGPVPEQLKANGEKVCGALDNKDIKYKASGYHPAGKDLDGKPFVGGGYFCVVKENSKN
jgi:hypothetical protein